NRALVAAEISAIYSAGAGGKCLGPTLPSITVQPSDQTASAGTNASFTVLAAGSAPLSYSWQFHGTNVAGGTNYVLNITNVQFALAGSYQVIITNSFGAVTSAVATLTLQSPPVINNQPQSISVFPGSSAQFLVGVSGSPPFIFQ